MTSACTGKPTAATGITALIEEDEAMTSTEETWEPQPPMLLPPGHTPEREQLQEQARRFAMAEVPPVANGPCPRKGEIPATLLPRLGEMAGLGMSVPAEHGGLG